MKAPVNAKDLKRYSDPRNYRIPPNFSSNAGNDTNDQSVETDSEMRRIVDSGIDQSQQDEVCTDKDEKSDEKSDNDKQGKNLTDGIWYQANRILRQRYEMVIKSTLLNGLIRIQSLHGRLMKM